MIRLVSVKEMREIEREGDANGVSYAQMMERAGRGLAQVVGQASSHLHPTVALGLVGSGNNGGDTLVALEALARADWQVRAYLVRPRAAEDVYLARLIQAGGQVCDPTEDTNRLVLDDWLATSGIILDGVLGTGVQLPLRPELEAFLAHVGRHQNLPPVVAVDCPSGIDCDTGEASPATLKAAMTICMDAIKVGLLKFPANDFAGEIVTVSLGLPEGLPVLKKCSTFVAHAQEVRAWLPPRVRMAHKGTFGTLMIVAGCKWYPGAAGLAGEAAYRVGTGLVQMAVPASLQAGLIGRLLEATWLPLPETEGGIDAAAEGLIRTNLERVNTLLIGPGFGQQPGTAEFIRALFSRPAGLPPCVVDADGLRLLAKTSGWHKLLPPDSILTPHPGEMSALTGLRVDEIQADRLATAQKFACRWGHTVVLKGAFSVVASPDGRAHVIPVATAALARAGSGDLLAGMIAGLRAQGVASYEAAVSAAWIHGQAGLTAEKTFGHSASVLAGDVLAAVPVVLNRLVHEDWVVRIS